MQHFQSQVVIGLLQRHAANSLMYYFHYLA